MTKNLYDTVIKNGYDVRSGVYAVQDPKISIQLDEYGEYRYSSQELLKDPGLSKISAMSNDSPNESNVAEELFSSIPNMSYDPVIGHYSELYAGYVSEGDYRKNGSSGGLATWISVKLLNEGLIDGVIHVKESNDTDGILFKYCVSTTQKEIINRSKSRYYPVELSGVLNDIKLDDKRYAITGTPSVIMEVRLLCRQNKEIARKIKYTIGLIAGHHKSARYTDALAWEQGIKPGDLVKIDYRKKINGKPSNQYNTELTGYINGKLRTISTESRSSFIGNWGHGFFKSKLSDFTDDTFNETADVALGDAWIPKYKSDSQGTNIAIIRNPDIAKIMKDGINSKLIHVDDISTEMIKLSQAGLIHHTRDELPYRLHKKDRSNIWRPRKRFKASSKLTLERKLIQDIREKISTKSHVIFREALERDDWSYFKRKMKRYTLQYKCIYTYVSIVNKGPVWTLRRLWSKIIN